MKVEHAFGGSKGCDPVFRFLLHRVLSERREKSLCAGQKKMKGLQTEFVTALQPAEVMGFGQGLS